MSQKYDKYDKNKYNEKIKDVVPEDEDLDYEVDPKVIMETPSKVKEPVKEEGLPFEVEAAIRLGVCPVCGLKYDDKYVGEQLTCKNCSRKVELR